MDRLDGLCPCGDNGLDLSYVEVVCDRININKDRCCAETRDRANSREKAVRRRDDLVAGADIEGHQRKQDGVAARGTSDRVFCAAISRKLVFKLSDLAAKDKAVGI